MMSTQESRWKARSGNRYLQATLTFREFQALSLRAEAEEKKKVDLVRDWIRTFPEYSQTIEKVTSD